MVQYTITVRKIYGCEEFAQVRLSADNRLQTFRARIPHGATALQVPTATETHAHHPHQHQCGI